MADGKLDSRDTLTDNLAAALARIMRRHLLPFLFPLYVVVYFTNSTGHIVAVVLALREVLRLEVGLIAGSLAVLIGLALAATGLPRYRSNGDIVFGLINVSFTLTARE